MAKDYSWEHTSSYEPPRRAGFGWHALVAVVLALLVHVVFIFAAGNHLVKLDVAEPTEWTSEPITLTDIESDFVEPTEAPAEEVIERPIDQEELVDSTEDALADLQEVNLEMETQLEEAELPEIEIERPKLKGDEAGLLLKPVLGDNVNPDIPEPGQVKIDFPEAQRSQLVVADEGAPLADLFDPDAVALELGKLKGAGGQAEIGGLSGYTGLDAYAKMSPGELKQNKASIGSDLLFGYNEATLRDDARMTLLTVATLIERNPELYCWVEGHSDLFGSDSYNFVLSKRRAAAVKEWLVKALGLEASRIIVRGLGKTEPVVLKGSKEEQGPNRRVDIKMRADLPDAVKPPKAVVVKPVADREVTQPVEPVELKPVIPKAVVVEEVPRAVVVPEEPVIPKAIPVEEDE